MKTTLRFAIAAAVLGSLPAVAVAEQDCLQLAVSVKHAIEAKPAAVLEVVEAQVSANPGCACDVVKAAIEASKADAQMVAAIVETAATAAPVFAQDWPSLDAIAELTAAGGHDDLTPLYMREADAVASRRGIISLSDAG